MHFGTASFCIVSIKNRTNFLDTLFLLKCTTLQRVTKKGKNVTPAEQDPKQSLLFMPLRSPVLFPVDLHQLHWSHFFYYDKSRNEKYIHWQMWKRLAILQIRNIFAIWGNKFKWSCFLSKGLVTYGTANWLRKEKEMCKWQKVFLFANGYILPFRLLS